MLTITHVYLILRGQTTVENMQIRSMKEREERNLAKVYGFWQFGWVHRSTILFFRLCTSRFIAKLMFTIFLFRAKRRKLRQWDQEWGRLSKEGNIWWRGDAYEEWVDVMGKNPLGWICEYQSTLVLCPMTSHIFLITNYCFAF